MGGMNTPIPPTSDAPGYNEHMTKLKEVATELETQNDQKSRSQRNATRNNGTKLPQFDKGDLVVVRNESRKDSLDPKLFILIAFD